MAEELFAMTMLNNQQEIACTYVYKRQEAQFQLAHKTGLQKTRQKKCY